jgi:hypothetical protein
MKVDNPNVSFPANPTPSQLAEFYVFGVSELSTPAYDVETQRLVRDTVPVLDSSGWTLGWSTIALNQPQIDNYKRANIDQIYDFNVDSDRRTVYGMHNDKLRDVIGIIYTEARAFEANNTIATPAVNELSNVWGITKGDAVQRVIDNYGPYISNIAGAFARWDSDQSALLDSA